MNLHSFIQLPDNYRLEIAALPTLIIYIISVTSNFTKYELVKKAVKLCFVLLVAFCSLVKQLNFLNNYLPCKRK